MFTISENRRIEAIETKLNELQTAANNLATKRQLKELLNIRQAEIEQLKEEVALLKTRVTALENA